MVNLCVLYFFKLINPQNRMRPKQLHHSSFPATGAYASLLLHSISVWDLFHLDAVWHSFSNLALPKLSRLGILDILQADQVFLTLPLKLNKECVCSSCQGDFIKLPFHTGFTHWGPFGAWPPAGSKFGHLLQTNWQIEIATGEKHQQPGLKDNPFLPYPADPPRPPSGLQILLTDGEDM